jgi:glycosyltransferase involved in cell wall biosynthesis
MQATGELRELIPAGVRLTDLAVRGFGPGKIGLGISTMLRLARWIHQEEPTIMLSTVTGMNLAAILARWLAGSSAWLVIREPITLGNFQSRGWILMMRWLYRHADLVVAVSPTVKQQLIAKLNVPESRIRYIPNGVDKRFVRQQADLPNEHPWLENSGIKVLVAAGRLSPSKDYPTLLRAFSLLPRTPEARLLIVGEGPERWRLEDLIRSLGLEDRVQLVGFDINPWRWVSRADVFVLSSRCEGHPNSLLEALVLERPSVVTAFDDSVNEMGQRFGFMVVPAGNPSALAGAISRQLEHKESPGSVEQIPDIAGTAKKYLEVIQKARMFGTK